MLTSIATLPQRTMNAEANKVLFSLLLAQDSFLDVVREDLKDNFSLKLFGARCPENFKICDKVRLFVCSELVESPADIMLYLHAIYDDARKRGALNVEYTLDKFCELFPMGFPTRDSMSTLWDAQKCERKPGTSDNLIDDVTNW